MKRKTTVARTISLPPELDAAAARKARAEGRSFSNFIAQLLRENLATQTKS